MGHVQDASERLHQALLEHVSLNLQPGIRESIAEAVLQDHVTAGHAQRVLREGSAEIVAVLTEARDLLTSAVVWSGPEERRDVELGRIDALLAKYQPEPPALPDSSS